MKQATAMLGIQARGTAFEVHLQSARAALFATSNNPIMQDEKGQHDTELWLRDVKL